MPSPFFSSHQILSFCCSGIPPPSLRSPIFNPCDHFVTKPKINDDLGTSTAEKLRYLSTSQLPDPVPNFNSALRQQKHLATSNSEKSQNESEYPSKMPNFKHQDIEGPTVERDVSVLANETREVLERTMKSMYGYGLSQAMAILGLVQYWGLFSIGDDSYSELLSSCRIK